jgi:ABC-type amino acid transport substrate-binding protein
MKKLVAFFSFLPLVASLAGCNNQTLADGVFTIGFEAAYPPFNWTTTTKDEGAVVIANSDFLGMGKTYAAGYDVMIASHIASELDYDLQVRKISWDGLIPALNSGNIDAIIAGMTDTEARRSSVAFSDPYYESELVMLVRTSGAFALATSIDDFAGATLAAQIGTVQNDIIIDYASDDGEDDELFVSGLIAGTPYETYPDALLALLEPNSGLDGVLAERPIADAIMAEHGAVLTMIEFFDGEVYDANFLITVSVAVRHEDVELLDDINAVLANLSETTRVEWMGQAIIASNNQ